MGKPHQKRLYRLMAEEPLFVQRIKEYLEPLARPIHLVCLIAAIGIAGYWFIHVPPPGYAVAILGVVAIAMAVNESMHPGEKVVWMIIVFALLIVELRAIDKDRQENQRQQSEILAEETRNFKAIIEGSEKNFRDILTNQQESHISTMRVLVDSQRKQGIEFEKMLTKQEHIIKRQEKLAESLSGELVPASDPIPPNGCRNLKDDDVIILLGTNAVVTKRFPHTILQINEQSVVSIDRTESGSLALLLDIRGNDNKIITRLNKSGFVVNRNNTLQLIRPDKNTIIIEDEYGEEVLNARFLNPKAFRINGILNYKGRKIKLEIPMMRDNCFSHSGKAAIAINFK